MCTGDGQAPGSVAEALRTASASLDYLIPAAAELPAVTCGEALTALGEIQAKFAAAHAAVLRRFDALDGHNSDGYATSAAWLAAMGRMSARDAKTAVRKMRTLRQHRPLGEALGRSEISVSWADQILKWIQKLPHQLRDDTETVLAIEKILVQAAAAGASLSDLKALFARAVVQWQAEHPDVDQDDGFDDRFVRASSTFGGVGVLRGNLTRECAAACDASTIPVVTGHVDMTVADNIIELALSAGEKPVKAKEMSPEAWRALRYAIAKLAVDLVSGPTGLAAYLRTQLLEAPWNKPSLPLDIGWSDSIPWYIRKAVLLRDRTCAWPHCGRAAAYCDVHHRRHKKDGGETSVDNCVLVCQFHHDVCIHRWGWELVVHPDGTTSAYGPNGQVIHSHSPPTTRAA